MAKHRAKRNEISYGNDVRSHRAKNVGSWDDGATRRHRMKDNDSAIRRIAQHFRDSTGSLFKGRNKNRAEV